LRETTGIFLAHELAKIIREGTSWRSKIAHMQVANVESRRERAFPKAAKCTAANNAPTRRRQAVLEIAVAVMRSAEEDDGIRNLNPCAFLRFVQGTGLSQEPHRSKNGQK
jgi:hypothetical protein